MATRKRIRKLIAEGSAYIDPLHANSVVSYKVISGARYIWGSVQLSDCNQRIDWYVNGTDTIDKITKAIVMLEEFKKAFLGATKRTRRKTTRTK